MADIIIAIIGIYIIGAVICFGVIVDEDNLSHLNPCISILWPIIFLIIISKGIIIAFKEIPKIWKM